MAAAISRDPNALRETPELSQELEDLFQAAEDLGDNPSTLLALKDLRQGAVSYTHLTLPTTERV